MSPLQHRRIVPAWLGQALGLLFAVSMLQADPAAFEKANKLYNDDQYAEAAAAASAYWSSLYNLLAFSNAAGSA